ncbi:hypothetical protein B0H10DRAFT_2211187 [Mycena sp. CBHHK59/15]|nr:hypothetical protein B0H10DRAFT_2211187 [Mycena sp. CBHHK59/15]
MSTTDIADFTALLGADDWPMFCVITQGELRQAGLFTLLEDVIKALTAAHALHIAAANTPLPGSPAPAGVAFKDTPAERNSRALGVLQKYLSAELREKRPRARENLRSHSNSADPLDRMLQARAHEWRDLMATVGCSLRLFVSFSHHPLPSCLPPSSASFPSLSPIMFLLRCVAIQPSVAILPFRAAPHDTAVCGILSALRRTISPSVASSETDLPT